VAYVYDPDDALTANLNTEMVDLDEFDDADAEWLHDMLVAHVDATDSAVGQRILSDWPKQMGDFVKVMPRDKSVLQAIAAAEPRARTSTGDHGGGSWLTRPAF
jgi:glutamate synthase (NADPH/NADH) large chain